jgi:putative ATP-binding cassette transporter
MALTLMFLAMWMLFMDWARNIWQRDFWDSIEKKNKDKFLKAMLLFCLMAIVRVLSSTYEAYISSIMHIRWRAVLTKNLQEKWLLSRAYCIQHFPASAGVPPLENPDQRIQEDVDSFIGGGLGVFFGLISAVGSMALFCPILFKLSPDNAFGSFYCPGWLLYAAIIYSLLGSVITHFLGQWLVPLNFIKQRVEADFRHTAVQVRDHTESIAMYGSEETEHNRLTSRFDVIQRVVWEQMKFEKQLGYFRNCYFLLDAVVPFCLVARNYFSGEITLGQMMQILGALGHVSAACNTFVSAYPMIAGLRATTDRLYGFYKATEKGAEFIKDATLAKEVSAPGDTAALFAQDVSVKFAGDGEKGTGERILWDKAGLVVQPGERVLLLGPDGCGKSVFLRSLAGAWPGSGSVRIGTNGLFVPQRPFVPEGQLRDALAYPEQASAYTDDEMMVALKAVNIKALDDVSLDEEADWLQRLSGGEMQRLAIAHALLRKPGLLVLDETTAAIGEEGTAELYATLGKLLPASTAVVSVDHDAISQVGNWHNVHYEMDQGTHTWHQTR